MANETTSEAPLEPASSVGAQLMQAAVERSIFGNEAAPIRLGRFVVVDRIGQGAMGVVYRAFDPELGRAVAIKVLARGRADHPERARREAQILARLNHPNVVTVHEVGVEHGRLYVAMELVDGASLDRWCREHPVYDAARARALTGMFEQAVQGLLAAHRAGIVHRDVKPGNILVDEQGRVRIADFGLARLEREDSAEQSLEATLASGSGTEHLTATGARVGTPAYMAPEQFAGHASERSDQFGLCAAFFEAFHGMRPFAGSSVSELESNIGAGRLATPPRRGVPDRIARVLARGLAVDPEQRWPGTEALATALHRAATPRRIWPAIGATGLAGFVGVLAVLDRAEGDPCAGAQEQLEGVWDDDARARTLAALAGSGVVDATDLATRTVAGLDAYADAWRAGHRDACEATHVRHEQSDVLMDARMACLHERRRGLAALVSVLGSGEREVAARAVQAAQALASVAACADTEYVSAPIEQPDPSIRAKADALRDEIARAEALTLAGRFKEGRAVAEQAATEAAALGFAPLVGSSLRHRGVLEMATGAIDASERSFREGLLAATRGRDDETVFNITMELAGLIGLYRERHDDGLWWADVARANAARIDQRSARMWRLPLTIGALRERQGRYDEAMVALEEAHAILIAEGREQTYAGAEVLSRISTVHELRGDLEVALQTTRTAAVMAEEILGSAHEAVASYVANTGSVLQKMGRDDEAMVELERALSMREHNLGPEHPHVADSLMSLAVLHKNRGELQPALARLQQALAVYEKAMGADHPRVARCLGNLGNLYVKLHEYDRAFAALERAAKIFEKELGPEHPDVAKTLQALGNAEWKRGDAAAAKATFDRALAIQEKSLGPENVALASTLTLRGEVLLDLGRPADALVDLERALALRGGKSVRPEQRAGLEFALARALWDGRSDRARARALAKSAADVLAAANGAEEVEARGKIERWLAERGATTAAPP